MPKPKARNPLETVKEPVEQHEPDAITTKQVNEKQPNKFFHWVKRHKKAVVIGVLATIIIGGGTAMAFGVFGSKNQATITKIVKKSPPKPTTMPSPLTGVQVTPEVAEQPVYASIIENSPDARPQSGLSEAGVVYEALAEGGITRFLALFLDTKPKEIGPIRSIRTYFVDWALEFNAPLMHVGGNIDALDMIGPNNVKDINQFYNSAYFYRSSDRYAPHNVYMTQANQSAVLKDKKWDKAATFTPNARQKDTPAATPTNPLITVNYSGIGFQSKYTYTAATNNYARSLAGVPHIDRNTNQQIMVKNVVVQYMPTTYGKTRIGELSTRMATPGSGKAVVFRDGIAIEGTWTKSSHTSRTKLLDAAGKEIPLNAGNTWYNIVPVGNTVTY